VGEFVGKRGHKQNCLGKCQEVRGRDEGREGGRTYDYIESGRPRAVAPVFGGAGRTCFMS